MCTGVNLASVYVCTGVTLASVYVNWTTLFQWLPLLGRGTNASRCLAGKLIVKLPWDCMVPVQCWNMHWRDAAICIKIETFFKCKRVNPQTSCLQHLCILIADITKTVPTDNHHQTIAGIEHNVVHTSNVKTVLATCHHWSSCTSMLPNLLQDTVPPLRTCNYLKTCWNTKRKIHLLFFGDFHSLSPTLWGSAMFDVSGPWPKRRNANLIYTE